MISTTYLVSPTGETIATSEIYKSKPGADGIRSVKEHAPKAEVDDKT